MMKFFRKYTKTLLAVFMALLLVVWLGGEALRNIFDRDRDYGKTVIARAWGENVQQKELAHASSQSEIGASLIGPAWSMPWRYALAKIATEPQMMRAAAQQLRYEPLSLDEWYLLETEARRTGVHVSQEDVNELRNQLPAEHLNAVRNRQNLAGEDIDAALQAYLRVEESAVRGASAVKVSEADIQEFVRETTEKVDVDMVLIDAQKLIDKAYQPPENEVTAQFDKYKDKPAGRGGSGDFGYRLPEATQVEFIEVNVAELAKAQSVTDDEAYEYWSQHKAEFTRPATQPASAPATQTRPEAPKPYDTFTEAKPHVRQKLQNDKATKAAARLAEELIRQLARPWANQPTTQPGGYKQPPAGEMAGNVYEKLVASLQSRYGAALIYGRTGIDTAETLASNAKIGRAAAFSATPQRVAFNQVAFMAAGLSEERKANPGYTRLFRNLYETCAEPLVDSAGNAFVFRNLTARPSQPPASLAEVRDTVIADLRQIKAYQEAEKIARELAEKAKGSSLKQAFQADAALAAKLESKALQEPEPFPRKQMFNYGGMPQLYPGFVPGVGRDNELMDLCFSLAGRATATQPTPVAVHAQPDRQRWVIVEWKKTLPVTHQEYNERREMVRDFLRFQKQIEFLSAWFDPQSIRERTGWVEVDGNGNPIPKKEQPKPAA